MRLVLGVDEAGRGPLAGPVAVGVVAAEEGFDFLSVFPGLNDSKKLTEKRREALFETLKTVAATGAISFCVKSIDARTIDTAGISRSVISAVHAGVRELAPGPDDVHVYLDGLLHAPEEYAQETVIGGDGIVPAIMLASVAAKVTRDRLMVRLSADYPEYDFAKHKGYGTKAHQEAIRTYGLCDLHRRSFCRNFA